MAVSVFPAVSAAEEYNFSVRSFEADKQITLPTGTYSLVVSAEGSLSGSMGPLALNGATVSAGTYTTASTGAAVTLRRNAFASWSGLTSNLGGSPSSSHFGNNLFLVGGTNGVVSTSTDGLTWTARTTGAASNNPMRAIASDPSQFVMSDGIGGVRTSPDGITWTYRGQKLDGGNSSNAIVFGNGLYVLAGNSATLATSTDGVNWTSRTSGFVDQPIFGLAFGNGIFVAGGGQGRITTSTNGITWTSQTSGFGSDQILEIAFGNGIFVAVGTAGKVATSPDGVNWTLRTVTGWGTQTINAACFGGGVFLIAGANQQAAASSDGITWSIKPQTGFTAQTAVAGGANNIFIIGGDGGGFVQSSLGSTAQSPMLRYTRIQNVVTL